jgi:hypothetical protein
MCLFGGVYAGLWLNEHKQEVWYLRVTGESSFWTGFNAFFTWFSE